MTKRVPFFKLLTLAACAVTAALVCHTTVYADGSAFIDVPEGVQQGSSVTVSVTVKCDSDIGIVSGNLSYDESVLEFVSSDYASGGGGELVIPGAFPDSPSSQMTLDFTFSAIAEGDALIDLSGYVFDTEGTVIADISAGSSVTVGGNLPPEPDEPDAPEETEVTTTTPAETEPPEESKPIETEQTVTEAPQPEQTDLTEEAEPAQAQVVSSAASSSSKAANTERTDLAQKLTIPLLIILATLILALVIVTVWIKNRMKKK